MLNIGDTLQNGQYKIIFLIAESPTANVYLGRDEKTKELFAIKVIERKTNGSEDFKRAFSAEAKKLEELREDPHMARFQSFGQDEKHLYIVMEYIPGKTIAEFIQSSGPMDEIDALKIVRQAAEALRSAHNKRILHSDIKPTNIMVTPISTVKVLDFGLALDVSKVTSSQFRGTPVYMSPEQVDPQTRGTPDFRSDIYSLGATLYEMLSARPPFSGSNLIQLAREIDEKDPPPLHRFREDILPDAENLVKRCLRKDRKDRYQSAEELIEAIDQILDNAEDPGCARLKEAKRSFNEENWETAISWCRRVPVSSSCHAEAQVLLAQAQKRKAEKEIHRLEIELNGAIQYNEREDVVDLCNRILKLDPDHARAKELLAEVDKRGNAWPQPRLVSVDSKKEIPLHGQIIKIGRPSAKGTPDIDLTGLEGERRTVSRNHAKIFHEPDGTWFLEPDSESKNETRVNGEVIEKGTKRPIVDGNELQFGDVKLTFRTDSPEKQQL